MWNRISVCLLLSVCACGSADPNETSAADNRPPSSAERSSPDSEPAPEIGTVAPPESTIAPQPDDVTAESEFNPPPSLPPTPWPTEPAPEIAAAALRRDGEALEKFVTDGEYSIDRHAAACALLDLQGADALPLLLDAAGLPELAGKIADLGPTAVEPLTAALRDSNRPSEQRRMLVTILAHTKDERALSAVLEFAFSEAGSAIDLGDVLAWGDAAASALRQSALSSTVDAPVRVRILRAMTTAGVADCFTVLAAVIADDKCPQELRKAVVPLFPDNDPAVVDLMASLLEVPMGWWSLDDLSKKLVTTAPGRVALADFVRANPQHDNLYTFAGVLNGTDEGRALLHDNSAPLEVRVMLLGGSDNFSEHLGLLKDAKQTAELRLRAGAHLGALLEKDDSHTQELIGLLETSDVIGRRSVARALRPAAGDRGGAVNIVVAWLGDNDTETVDDAAALLGSIADPLAFAPLVGAYDQRNDADLADALLRIALNDSATARLWLELIVDTNRPPDARRRLLPSIYFAEGDRPPRDEALKILGDGILEMVTGKRPMISDAGFPSSTYLRERAAETLSVFIRVNGGHKGNHGKRWLQQLEIVIHDGNADNVSRIVAGRAYAYHRTDEASASVFGKAIALAATPLEVKLALTQRLDWCGSAGGKVAADLIVGDWAPERLKEAALSALERNWNADEADQQRVRAYIDALPATHPLKPAKKE